jgi:hypothetical protein
MLQLSGLWVVGDIGRPSRRSSRKDERRKVDEWGRRSSPADKETLLKQYELIRGEVTTSLQLQQQLLGFGVATIGLLAGAAFVARATPFRSELLVVLLPLVCYLAVMIWFSEVMRMHRAGGFLLTIEKKLDTCGDGSLVWEYRVARDRLRKRGLRFASDPDWLRLGAVTLLFFTLAGESIKLGWDDASSFAHRFAVTAGVIAALVMLRLFRLRVGERNDLLEVRAGSERSRVRVWRDVAVRARLLADRIPRRRSSESEPRERRLLTPVAAASA